MHPSLRTNELNQLLPSLRKCAKAAANKSLEDLEQVVSHCLALSKASRYYLPIVYANLDPADIPDPTPAEAGSTPPPSVRRALRAFDLLTCILDAPPGAYKDLWPRIWAWLQFVELQAVWRATFWQSFEVAAVVLLSPFASIVNNDAAMAPVHSTPGVLAFLGRIWIGLRGITTADANRAVLFLHDILGTYRWTSALLDELSEDLPRGANDLTTLIVEGLSFDPNCTSCGLLRRSLLLLCAWTHAALTSNNLAALFSAGILKAVIGVLRPLNDLDLVECLQVALRLLVLHLFMRDRYEYLPQALRVGLLPALAAILQNRAVDAIPAELFIHFLNDIIPGGTMYRRVARTARDGLSEFPQVDWTRFRDDKAIRAAWSSAEALFTQSAGAVQLYESPEFVKREMCDNRKCQVIKSISELKRCAGCCVTFYCDKKCQRAEWAAGHGIYCKHVSAESIRVLHTGEYRFLRYLVHSDYLRHKLDVLLKQLCFLYEHGATTLFVTVFDYHARTSAVPVTIGVIPLASPELDDSEFRTLHLSSAKLRFGCHRVILDAGGVSVNPERVVRHEFLLRSAGPELHDGLMRLLELLPERAALPAEKTDMEKEFPAVYRGLVELSEMDLQEVY
ncbi:hypothetical protein C8F01DRAFT_1121457 [Mycena amicta]|nr:hypothetical protein C8F01DRAFT_1121457 [Mycena amicta]